MLFFRHQVMVGVACSVMLLGGCGDTSWHDTWKSTKGTYYTYVNAPASIDYSDTGDLSESEVLLADNMRGIDLMLTRFERYMSNQDRPPSPESVSALFSRFPWITGVAALSAEGAVLAKEPPSGLKPIDFAPILTFAPLGERGLRADVQETPFGPEMLLGVPIFASAELKGYLVSHFDIRTLLNKAKDPANLVILSPKVVLWPGQFVIDQTPLQGIDWAAVTKGSIRGSVSNSNGSFVWIARHVGGVPLIFATPAKGGSFPTNPGQLSVLDELGVTQQGNSPIGEKDLVESSDTTLLREPEMTGNPAQDVKPISD